MRVMTMIQLTLAFLGLLFTPGPTNTLLALAGAERGWRRAANLLPAETLGYLAAVLPLWLLRLWVDPANGPFGLYVKIAAAAWVAWLALKLARSARAKVEARGSVGHNQILITTFLNPKSLLIALVILPPPTSGEAVQALALFTLTVPVVGLIWCGLGGLLRQGAGDGGMAWFKRIGALWLGALALGLAHSALSH